jgi:hypothetical protein
MVERSATKDVEEVFRSSIADRFFLKSKRSAGEQPAVGTI